MTESVSPLDGRPEADAFRAFIALSNARHRELATLRPVAVVDPIPGGTPPSWRWSFLWLGQPNPPKGSAHESLDCLSLMQTMAARIEAWAEIALPARRAWDLSLGVLILRDALTPEHPVHITVSGPFGSLHRFTPKTTSADSVWIGVDRAFSFLAAQEDRIDDLLGGEPNGHPWQCPVSCGNPVDDAPLHAHDVEPRRAAERIALRAAALAFACGGLSVGQLKFGPVTVSTVEMPGWAAALFAALADEARAGRGAAAALYPHRKVV